MINAIRFVVILFVVWMVGAPLGIGLLKGLTVLYPGMTLIPFVLSMIAVAVIFALSFRFDWRMSTIVSGILLEALGCILLITQWQSGTPAPWMGAMVWIGGAMGVTMTIDELIQIVLKRYRG